MRHARMIRRLYERGKYFGPATKGNVAITFAIALVPMALATLGVVQYGLALSVKTQLNAIADAAALQAVSNPAVVTYANTGTTGQAAATNMFNAQASLLKTATVTSLSVTVVPTAATTTAPGYLTATVTYTAKLPSIASGLLGANFTKVNGTSTATSSVPAYANFFLLLDGSPSMGIGSTPANIATMQNENNGCGFACHSPDATQQNYPGYTVPNVPDSMLRIGALQSATSQLVQTAINTQSLPSQYKIGVWGFANTVTTISSLTTNLSQIQTQISNLTLPTTDLGTQIADAVDWLGSNVVTTASGTGTKTSPYEFVFLVTDGVEDHGFNYTPGNYDTLTSPAGYWYGTAYSSVMDPTPCTALKNKGVTVAVLYTNYDPLSDFRYTDLVQPFAGNIASTLQSCASPNFFFQADSASDISNAMQQMFAAAIQKAAHLSQ